MSRPPEKRARDIARYWERRRDPEKWAQVLVEQRARRRRKTEAGESYQGDVVKRKLREIRYLSKPEVEARRKSIDTARNRTEEMRLYQRNRMRKRRASQKALEKLIANGPNRFETIAREIHDHGYSL